MKVFDPVMVRGEFPVLGREIVGKPYTYLDNAATTHKPRAVIDCLTRFYAEEYATVHRGIYHLSQLSTERFEKVRAQTAAFLGAESENEIIFTRGTTESINLVAQCFGRGELKPGDEVLISAMEHHSNIVPWQMACEASGAKLRVIPMDERGDLVLDALDGLLSERTRLVSFNHVSNALGTLNPVAEIVRRAKAVGAAVLIDGAQSVSHMKVNVKALGCDFYAFSGHKLFGPTGVGVLWGRAEWLDRLPPWQGGGDMIERVRFEKTDYAESPRKFEAGTPAIAPVIGLGATLSWLEGLDREGAARHEDDLVTYAASRLLDLPGLRLIGQPRQRSGAISFVIEGAHPHDVATVLDAEGVAVRAGHHCAQPVMDFFRVSATNRASFALYNTREDVERLMLALQKVKDLF